MIAGRKKSAVVALIVNVVVDIIVVGDKSGLVALWRMKLGGSAERFVGCKKILLIILLKKIMLIFVMIVCLLIVDLLIAELLIAELLIVDLLIVDLLIVLLEIIGLIILEKSVL